MTEIASLKDLAPIVAEALIFAGVIVYIIRSSNETDKEIVRLNNEAHREKGIAHFEENKRRDDMLFALQKETLTALNRNTEASTKLISAIQINTDATRKVSDTLEQMRLEIAERQ